VRLSAVKVGIDSDLFSALTGRCWSFCEIRECRAASFITVRDRWIRDREVRPPPAQNEGSDNVAVLPALKDGIPMFADKHSH
jgi:hypothetical protein